MAVSAAAKKVYYKTGKSFVLLFNRVSMYGVGHPFSVHSVDEFTARSWRCSRSPRPWS